MLGPCEGLVQVVWVRDPCDAGDAAPAVASLAACARLTDVDQAPHRAIRCQ